MNVVLCTSPHVRHAAVLESDFQPADGLMYTFAPVGLLSLIAMIRRHRPNDHGEIYDLNRRLLSGEIPLNGSMYSAVAREIVAVKPDMVGFMTECDSYHHVLQICQAIKSLLVSCHIVLGGPHATAVAAETMEKCTYIDSIVQGEGELTLIELIASSQAGGHAPVAGAITRSSTGVPQQGASRNLVENLDELPIPAYDLHHGSASEEIFLEVGRGCPFQCEFCSTAPFWKRRHRVKSPARIVEEIASIKARFGTQRVHFTHDLFTTNKAWVRAVCSALVANGAPVRWTCSARTDTVDLDLLKTMASAGCDAIYFGIESGSQRLLKLIKKDIPLEQSFEALSACAAAGIRPNVGFIAGFPCEDLESLQATFQAYERALRTACRPTHIFGYCPFAESSLYSRLPSLQFDGHFVDIPLGLTVDSANRHLIGSDAALFGSYHRPPLPDIVPGCPNAIAAVDEFSPLIESALMPALAAAAHMGGMFEVFRKWVRWVSHINNVRGVPAYRLAYGTPIQFLMFLEESLESSSDAAIAAKAAIDVIRVNLEVARQSTVGRAVTMATYRSLPTPELAPGPRLSLNTRIAPRAILAMHRSAFDVRPLLEGRFVERLETRATCLVWHSNPAGDIRVLEVDDQLFGTILVLRPAGATAGEAMLALASRELAFDAAEFESDVATLEREGLLEVTREPI